VHLHAVPDCSAPDAMSAMGHWNPDMMMHGLPTGSMHHLGDCGNFDVGADGKGTLTITKPEWTIGTNDMTDVGQHALIVNQGTVYLCLVRLLQKKWIKAEWGASDNNRKAKYYSITKAGRAQLKAETENWERISGVIDRLLNPISGT